MLSRIHNKLGTAGLVVAIVALVAALGGAAYAASDNHLSGGEKKEVTKIAKKYAGKPGPQGPAGTNGTNGTNGAKGATGPKGATGEKGEKGLKGDKGATGATGPEGSPWTAGGILPKGKTETGAWGVANSNNFVYMPFNIPLATAPKAVVLIGGTLGLGSRVVPEGAVEESVCEGSVTEPSAPEGVVCVYVDKTEESALVGLEALTKRYKSGATFFVGAGEGRAFGTWAVTGD